MKNDAIDQTKNIELTESDINKFLNTGLEIFTQYKEMKENENNKMIERDKHLADKEYLFLGKQLEVSEKRIFWRQILNFGTILLFLITIIILGFHDLIDNTLPYIIAVFTLYYQGGNLFSSIKPNQSNYRYKPTTKEVEEVSQTDT